MFAEQMSPSISDSFRFSALFSVSYERAKGKTLEGNPRPLLGRSLAFLINLEQGYLGLEGWEDLLRPGI